VNETFEIDEFSATMSDEGTYVLTVEVGELMTGEAMRRYLQALERFVDAAGATRVLFDARRDGPPRAGDRETREARWDHLAGRTVITCSAVVVESEIAQARVNMTARARKVVLQAFVDRPSAERWLRERA
jgi:hypothetical protein